MRELKEGDSMLLKTGNPPETRGAVSLSNRLKVRVPGKKSKKGSLDVKLVNLINDKENVDGNNLIPELLKNDEEVSTHVGGDTEEIKV